MAIPVIENIHQKVFEATKLPNALAMDNWHKDDSVNEEGAYCGTTHCRAGWVVTLAGKEGRDLELMTDTLFAAMQIYKKSAPTLEVSPNRFFDSNDDAMKDMERCAEEEQKLNSK